MRRSTRGLASFEQELKKKVFLTSVVKVKIKCILPPDWCRLYCELIVAQNIKQNCSCFWRENVQGENTKCDWLKIQNTMLRKMQNAICEKYKTVPAAAFGISAEKLQSWWAEKMHLWAQKVSLQRGRNKILFKYNMFWANWWQKHKIQMVETKCKIQFAWNTIYVHYFGWDELLSQSMKIILEGKIGNTICVKYKMQNVFLILGGRMF